MAGHPCNHVDEKQTTPPYPDAGTEEFFHEEVAYRFCGIGGNSSSIVASRTRFLRACLPMGDFAGSRPEPS